MRHFPYWWLCTVVACSDEQGATPVPADVDSAAPRTRKTCSTCAFDADCESGWECDTWRGVCKTAEERFSGAPECDIDCRMFSWNDCKDAGACSAVDGRCVATSVEMCAASAQCQYVGACTLVASLARCVPATDADCASSLGCAYKGNCEVHDGVCMRHTACGWELGFDTLKPDPSCKGNVGCSYREVHCECACSRCADELCIDVLCDDSESCFVDAH